MLVLGFDRRRTLFDGLFRRSSSSSSSSSSARSSSRAVCRHGGRTTRRKGETREDCRVSAFELSKCEGDRLELEYDRIRRFAERNSRT